MVKHYSEEGKRWIGLLRRDEVKDWVRDEAHRIEQETWQGIEQLRAGGQEDRGRR